MFTINSTYNLFIFHHNDLDGRASAAIMADYFKRYQGDNLDTIRFFEVDYAVSMADLDHHIYDSPEVESVVVFVDYSFSNDKNIDFISDLINNGAYVIWIDHHRTSIDALKKLDRFTHKERFKFEHKINMSHCATWLAYEYCIEGITGETHPDIPKFIKYVDSYDTWSKEMPNTDEFFYGIESTNYTVSTILDHYVFHDDESMNIFEYGRREINSNYEFCYNMIEKGKAIIDYKEIEDAKQRKYCGFPVVIRDYYNSRDNDGCETYIGYAMNIHSNSYAFGEMYDHFDFVMPFVRKANGLWKYSIYSGKPFIECDKIAKYLNIDDISGGGHKSAAGFITRKCIFDSGNDISIKKKFFSDGYKIVFDTYSHTADELVEAVKEVDTLLDAWYDAMQEGKDTIVE